MKDRKDLILPEELFYTNEHVWVKPAEDLWTIGITDFAQSKLGGIVFVDLPEPGAALTAGEEFGSIESVKAVNGLFSPVSGTVEEANQLLESRPELINSNCYEDGWLIKIRPDSPQDIQSLLMASVYRENLK